MKLVDDVCNVAEGESGYWISKKWYKGIELLLFDSLQRHLFDLILQIGVWPSPKCMLPLMRIPGPIR